MGKISTSPNLIRIGEILARGIAGFQAAFKNNPHLIREASLSNNAKLVLRDLRRHGEASHVRLRELTGLKRASLNNALKELSDSELAFTRRDGRKLLCKAYEIL